MVRFMTKCHIRIEIKKLISYIIIIIIELLKIGYVSKREKSHLDILQKE